MSDRLKVFLVEDSRPLLESLRDLFEDAGHVVAAAARTAARAREILSSDLRWDVGVFDIRLDGEDALDLFAMAAARPARSPVIAYSAHAEASIVLSAVIKGAAGFIRKDDGLERLLDDVRVVREGGSAITPDVAALVLSWVRETGGGIEVARNPLTPAETRVLQCIADGLSYKETAARCVMGEGTVRTHIGHAYGKLGVHNSHEAVRAARQRGIRL